MCIDGGEENVEVTVVSHYLVTTLNDFIGKLFDCNYLND